MNIYDGKDPLIEFAKSHLQKNQIHNKKPKRKNKKPEKDLEKIVLVWLRALGFDVTVIEAKATFDPTKGRYIGSNVIPSFPDIVGNDREGNAVYIELKAPGKLSTLKDGQRKFLIRKIKTNCFAVCIDSTKSLEQYYDEWIKHHKSMRQIFLMSILP